MPDAVQRVLSGGVARLRLAGVADAVSVAALICAAGAAIGAAGGHWSIGVAFGLLVGMAAAGVVGWDAWRDATDIGVAAAIEAARPGFDNLLVTTAELASRPRPVREDVRAEIARQVADRLATHPGASKAVRIGPRLWRSMALAATATILVVGTRAVGTPAGPSAATLPGVAAGVERVRVVVTPPSYTSRPQETFDDAVEVTAFEGSTIRVDVTTGASGIDVMGAPAPFERAAGGFAASWTAEAPASLVISAGGGADRFLSLVVVPDSAPQVRVRTPARDLSFPSAPARVEIAVESTDDIGLSSMRLKYTRSTGAGESVTFHEGEVPLRLSRVDERHWQGSAAWGLAGLSLEDGDVLVYRAIVRDTNPRGTPVASESFLVEIGRPAAAAATGFALPADEKKFAISQQMVIYKTEQLLAARAEHGADWLEQTQGLAVEQRMVRAEVVFLGGGDVEDEVEEAAASDELVEGRLQNAGRAEMLRAINAMSRAEAELNGGRAAEALVFERTALAALERAFDRRRYFLRTVPERTRIDPSRRLTGELDDARSWVRDADVASASDPLATERQLLRDLTAAVTTTNAATAALAARVVAVDPASAEMRRAAVALAMANLPSARQRAVEDAMRLLRERAAARLAPATNVDLGYPHGAGALADVLRTARPRR